MGIRTTNNQAHKQITMTQQEEFIESYSVGEILREQREQGNIKLEEANQATKIPTYTLVAMEDDDFDALPPEAFAQGFYTIYAKFLGLNVQHVIEQYQLQKQQYAQDKKDNNSTVPTKVDKQIKSMATRPSVGPGTILGFILVLLVIVGALISWFVAWNPASYLSKTIRSDGHGSSLSQVSKQTIAKEPEKIQYRLQAHFPTISRVTVIKDAAPPVNYLFQAGDTRTWEVTDKITMILPENTKAGLTINGLSQTLPEPDNGTVTVKIPQHR